MEREIMFRAWQNGQMCEIDMNSKITLTYNKMCGWNISSTFDKYWLMGESSNKEGEFVLMQYTGLKDKNGKDIYEGDIVQTNHISKGTIAWSPMASQWWINFNDDVSHRKSYRELTPDFGDGQNYCQYLEIIGNIHENKELL